MPFIRGRYHINPIMGQALEAARQAEAALAARQNSGDNDSGDDSYADDSTGFRSSQDVAAKGPVHRVEIEAAEVVPNHSGRAARGFVVRIHHALPAPNGSSDGSSSGSVAGTNNWQDPRPAAAPAPETHVFADHGDMLDFLRDSLDQDSRPDADR